MTRRAIGTAGLLLILAVSAAACGGGGSELEGVYQAAAWTKNDTACDVEGPSVLATEFQTVFYVKTEEFFGQTFLNVNFCADQAECQMLAADDSTIHIGMWGFDEGGDGDGWTSKFYSGFPDANNMCQGEFVTMTMTGVAGQSVHVEVRSVAAGGFAPDSDGFCDDTAGETAAQGLPCTSLEVMSADFLSEL